MARIGIHLGVIVAVAAVAPVAADEAKSRELEVVATLGKNIKDTDFHEIAYAVVEGKRRTKKTALLKIAPSAALLHDLPARIEDLEIGAVAWIFGKPEERDVVGNVGTVVGVERFIKGGQLLVTGAKVAVVRNYKSADAKEKDLEWCRVEVEKPGKGAALSVIRDGNSYRVTMDKGFRVIVREEAGGDDAGTKLRKRLLRAGAVVVVNARATSERPEGADADIEVFEATGVVVVQKALAGYYGTMIALDLE